MDSTGPIPQVDLGVNRTQKAEKQQDSSFQETLKNFYYDVNHKMKEADQMTQEFAVGKRHDLHEIMIASEKANISFKLLLQIRNKLLEAYQEVIRMQF